ncbi:MAG: hypothetical protein ACM3QS_07220 [Bacteroidota bacterium]
MELKARITPGAEVRAIPEGWRLSIPAGAAKRYRLAELDNCTRVARRSFPHRSVDMQLRARVSSSSVPGTWGFGVWNDPYRINVGPGETLLNALALPNAAWFFFSSEHSYLSFRDDKPGQGFLAQTFRARTASLTQLAAIGAVFPLSRVRARRRLSRLIDEDGVRLDLDVMQWHTYGMKWTPGQVRFQVDGAIVLETDISPQAPLGTVIWIDNQYAAFTPRGRVGFGVLKNPAAWLEIEDLKLEG